MEAEPVADCRVHPATIPLRFAKDAPRTLLALPAGFAFITEHGLWTVILFALGITAVTIGWQALAWHRFRYGIGARGIAIESGILHRTRRFIPFERIQDVEVERGPLARLFGLAKLKIETGGGGSDEGVLDSVRVDEAERIRIALRQGRAEAGTISGSAPQKGTDEAPALFSMGLPRILLTGLFNFSLVYLAVIFAALQALEPILPFDLRDPARWLGLVNDNVRGWSFAAFAMLAGIILLLGVVTGIASTVLRDFGFRLTLEGEGLRRVRGLLTRSEITIPRRRIQLAMLTTGPFKQRFGWAELGFQTLGAEQNGKCKRETVAPLGTREEVAEILAPLPPFRTGQREELRRVSSRHFVRRLIIAGGLPVFIALVASLFWRPALLALLLLPLVALEGLIERRYRLYGRADGLLFVQSGVIVRRQWIIPAGRMQVLALSRTWLQRRLGLATLTIDTAGGSRVNPPRVVDMKEEDARALLADLKRAR